MEYQLKTTMSDFINPHQRRERRKALYMKKHHNTETLLDKKISREKKKEDFLRENKAIYFPEGSYGCVSDPRYEILFKHLNIKYERQEYSYYVFGYPLYPINSDNYDEVKKWLKPFAEYEIRIVPLEDDPNYDSS